MSFQPQRAHPRQPLSSPVEIRVINSTGQSQIVSAKTLNISQSGLFLQTRMRLGLGTGIAISVCIPTDISGSHRSYFRGNATVIHEQELPNGLRGYGLEFQCSLLPVHLNNDPRSTSITVARSERRRCDRHETKLPVRYRAKAMAISNFEIPAEAINMSLHGMFLTTVAPLPVGTLVNLHIQMPRQAFSTQRSIQYKGRVVHGQPILNGPAGYGIELDQPLSFFNQERASQPEVTIVLPDDLKR